MTTQKSGIYKIKNQVNDKFYIGSSEKIQSRFSSHKCNLRKNKHKNKHLQSSWNKHGGDAYFRFLGDPHDAWDLTENQELVDFYY